MFTDQNDWEDIWGQVVAQAWSDPAFKAKLLADPAGVLKDHGILLPAGFTVKIQENTDKVVNLVVPVKPAPTELSEDELHRAAGGHGCRGCRGCRHRCGCGGCGCERCGCERC
jgi:hypothetical protein